MAKFGVRWRKHGKGFSIGRIVGRIGTTILALYVGGLFLMYLGNSMLGTCSPFYDGLALIGWQVGSNTTATSGMGGGGIASHPIPSICWSSTSILYSTSSTGILVVVGLIGIATIVMQFVEFRMK